MIKFFRHIRKNLLMENKTSKYVKYAIGEIILVVIGILIALQINNWNENRKETKEELAILENLHEEFLENKKMHGIELKESNDAKQAGFTLMNLMGKSESTLSKENADSLLYTVLESGSFRPSENTINDLVQSGRLRLLRNKNLKVLLYNWQSALKSLDSDFERVEIKIDSELMPYLSKYYALKDIDKYGQLQWNEDTKLRVNKYAIFNDIEFENIMDDYLYRVASSHERVNDIGHILDDILQETTKLELD